MLILILSCLQAVDSAYPSDWGCSAVGWFICSPRLICPCCPRAASLRHTPPCPLCRYTFVRIIAHPLSSLMGLISINITVERTFVLPQPAFLANPFSWQWVWGGLHNYLTGFFLFKVTKRQISWALFDWCTAVGVWTLQTFRNMWQNGKKDTSKESLGQAEEIKIWGRSGRHLKCKSWL